MHRGGSFEGCAGIVRDGCGCAWFDRLRWFDVVDGVVSVVGGLLGCFLGRVVRDLGHRGGRGRRHAGQCLHRDRRDHDG